LPSARGRLLEIQKKRSVFHLSGNTQKTFLPALSEISAFVVFAAFFYAQIALLRPYLPWYLRHVIVCI
jgi:hypothetical protein